MPQLSIETFVSQYFWLVTILLALYYLSATKILPQIANIYKTRSKLEAHTTTSEALTDDGFNSFVLGGLGKAQGSKLPTFSFTKRSASVANKSKAKDTPAFKSATLKNAVLKTASLDAAKRKKAK